MVCAVPSTPLSSLCPSAPPFPLGALLGCAVELWANNPKCKPSPSPALPSPLAHSYSIPTPTPHIHVTHVMPLGVFQLLPLFNATQRGQLPFRGPHPFDASDQLRKTRLREKPMVCGTPIFWSSHRH